PAASGRPRARPDAGLALCGPRFLMVSTLNPVSRDRLREFLANEARTLGFDAVAVTTPDAVPRAAERLAAFVEAGRHGSMDWIAETAARRGSPLGLWPQVRSVI